MESLGIGIIMYDQVEAALVQRSVAVTVFLQSTCSLEPKREFGGLSQVSESIQHGFTKTAILMLFTEFTSLSDRQWLKPSLL